MGCSQVSNTCSLCGEQTPMKSIVSLTSQGYGSSACSDSKNGEIVLRTISEIYQQREYGDFWVGARIVFIDTDTDWYYVSCKKSGCNKKLSLKDNGLYYCGTCDRVCAEGNIRYRVKVRVVDVDGNAPFVLWDRECNDLLGIKAAKLKAKQIETQTSKLPTQIEGLVGMILIFRIAVRKEQFQNLQNAFSVMRILNDTKLIESHVPQLLEMIDKDLSSKLLTDQEDTSDDQVFLACNEAESPMATATQSNGLEGTDSSAIKRCLMDEFSSTQNSKKQKEFVMKVEK